MGRRFLAAALLAIVAASALPRMAAAGDLRFYSYDPETEASRHRTQDIILVSKPGLLGLLSSKLIKFYRRRGADELDLQGTDGTVSGGRLSDVLGTGPETEGLRVYLVDPVRGKGFAQGACKGADKAWIALKPAKPYENLRIYVLRYDATAKRAELCETLDYHWHGEWILPEKAAHNFEQSGPAGVSAPDR